MNSKLIITALRRYSPEGLCSDTLIEKNGARESTVGCATACLALFAVEKSYKIADKATSYLFNQRAGKHAVEQVSQHCEKQSLLDVEDLGIREEIEEFFDLKPGDLANLIGVNDTCIFMDLDVPKKGCRCEDCVENRRLWREETRRKPRKSRDVPLEVVAEIHRLRLKQESKMRREGNGVEVHP